MGVRRGACGGILLSRQAGALGAYYLVELQCEGDCAVPQGIGVLVGADMAAGGMAIVADLVMRALHRVGEKLPGILYLPGQFFKATQHRIRCHLRGQRTLRMSAHAIDDKKQNRTLATTYRDPVLVLIPIPDQAYLSCFVTQSPPCLSARLTAFPPRVGRVSDGRPFCA